MQNNPKKIIVHCSDVSYRVQPDQFNSINSYHRDVREFPKSSLGFFVGYHYLYTGGKEYVCKLETDIGAHCNQQVDGKSLNYQSIGLCLGFDGDIEYPPAKEEELLKKRLLDLMKRYNIKRKDVEFHRAYATDKTCPGSLITDKWLDDILAEPIATPIVKPIENSCYQEKETIKLQQQKLSMWEAFIKNLFRG